MFRKLLKLIVFIVCLGIVTVLITAALLATENGSRWLVYRVIDHNDIPLTIEKVQGRLLDTISFHGLHYLDRNGNEFSIKNIKLVWSPVELLAFNLDVTSIDIDQLAIQAAPGGETDMPEIPAIEFPLLPVTVNIGKLELYNARLLNADGEQQIEQMRANLAINEDKLVLRIEHVRSADQQLSGIAKLVRKKIPEVDVDLQWSGTIENELSQAYLQLKGPQNDLAMQFELGSKASIRAHGNLDLVTVPHTGTLQGEISGKLPQELNDHVEAVSPLIFALKGNTNFIDGHFATKLQTAAGEKFSLEMESHAALPGKSSQALNINLDWKTTPDEENPLLTLSGQGDMEYRDHILTIDHQLATPWAIRLTGNIGFAGQTELDLKLDWQDIHVALSDDSAIQVPSGYLDISGTSASLAI
ncbi:MAG TPA: hypothetical protein VJ981_02150, partial [Gammaproteobacteria bacterium]|nr:hypothetical protein [Gammaproteobacteria bacterium]